MLRHVTDALLNLALRDLAAPCGWIHGWRCLPVGILLRLVRLSYFLVHLQVVQTHFYPSRTSSYHRSEKENSIFFLMQNGSFQNLIERKFEKIDSRVSTTSEMDFILPEDRFKGELNVQSEKNLSRGTKEIISCSIFFSRYLGARFSQSTRLMLQF